MSAFLDSSDSRQTSPEILKAIWECAAEREDVAARIWDEPTSGELVAIIEIVTKNGLVASTDFCWGASGTRWAE
jgi:hypothetical protein